MDYVSKYSQHLNSKLSLPLCFCDEPSRHLLHHYGFSNLITLNDLTNFCIKFFGEKAYVIEEALIHGKSIETENGTIYLELDF